MTFVLGFKHSEESKRKIGLYWKGRKRGTPTKEHREKLRIANLGQKSWHKGIKGFRAGIKHTAWKGDNIKYSSLHKWVSHHKGKPIECLFCGVKEGKLTWANKSHEYKRDLSDWIPLCYKCHWQYDRKITRPKIWDKKTGERLMLAQDLAKLNG